MNWEAIGAIGEIIGALAVIATLIYLAAQIKINTAAINQAARQTTLIGRGEASKWVAWDQEISKLLWKGAADPECLTTEEFQRFIIMVGSVVRPTELAFLDFQEGRMSEKLWSARDDKGAS
ncbi:MAG: hypothetical protein OXU30_11110 [Gammaproteobacteria bacterium]|nr:hypothetical protein [Gammaproteobacteria bacterium]